MWQVGYPAVYPVIEKAGYPAKYSIYRYLLQVFKNANVQLLTTVITFHVKSTIEIIQHETIPIT